MKIFKLKILSFRQKSIKFKFKEDKHYNECDRRSHDDKQRNDVTESNLHRFFIISMDQICKEHEFEQEYKLNQILAIPFFFKIDFK